MFFERLKETNGDVDIIITRKDGLSFEGFLDKLILKQKKKNKKKKIFFFFISLETIGFLTDHLALPNKSF